MIRDPYLVFNAPLWQLDGSSFMEKSAYGRLCTVSGATWGMQGRPFDGTDDQITCSDASLPAGKTARTIILWVKNLEPAGATGTGYLFRYGTAALDQWQACYILNGTADIYYSGSSDDFDSGINLDDSDFHCLMFTFDGTNARVYKDLIEAPNSPTAKASWNTVLGGTLALGSSSGASYLKVIIGESAIYSKLFSEGERQSYFFSTKWRYK